MRMLAGRITQRRKPVRYAITDLYDEERRTLLVQYPVGLIIAIALTGIIVFALTGFLGYPGTASADLFGNPIVLLPWLYALQIVLLLSIFRDPSLRWRRFVIVGMTLLVIVLLAAAALNSDELQTVIQQYLQRRQQPVQQPVNGPLLRLASDALTYTVINFVILGVFWLDTARRWLRRAMGYSPNPDVDLGLGYQRLDEQDKRVLPRIETMVSGDLLAAAVLSLALGLLFAPGFVGHFVTVSGQPSLDWLSTFDILQTLVTLPLGLIILGLAATINGLRALEPSETDRAQTPSAPLPRGSARKEVSYKVGITIIETLQSALDRRLRAAVAALALSLRNILWPLLIVISTVGLAVSAELLEVYLHDTNKADPAAVITVLLAVGLGVVAAFFTVFAAALFLFSRRVATNSLRFLGLIGFVVLLTFWLFSAGLSAINLFLLWTKVTTLSPFWPPAISTGISFLALVIYGVLAIRRRMRGPEEGDTPTADTGGDPVTSGEWGAGGSAGG